MSTSPSKKKKVVVAAFMAAVLIGAIAFCWVTASDNTTEFQIGQALPGMELPIVTSQGIQSETIDPATTGKVTIINFWGTWCGGCVEELPYFDRVADEYADSVQVIAIHTDMLSDTAPDYIAANYANSHILFAKDLPTDSLDAYYSLLGGLGGYPYTVVIDENGIVLTSVSSALTYEDLQQIIETALKK